MKDMKTSKAMCFGKLLILFCHKSPSKVLHTGVSLSTLGIRMRITVPAVC